MVVEDETLILMSLEVMLEALGCEVVADATTVKSGREALERVEPDLVLLDIDLRGERSTAIAEDLQARSIPYIVISAHDPQRVEPRILREAPFLSKPFGETELAREIGRTLAAAA